MENISNNDVNLSFDFSSVEDIIYNLFIPKNEVINLESDSYAKEKIKSLNENIFESEFKYDYSKPNILELSIYYKQDFFLLEIFNELLEKGKRIFDYIKVADPPFEYGVHELYDFNDSELSQILEGNASWKLGRKPVVLLFKRLTRYSQSNYGDNSIFHLSTNSFSALSRGYFTPYSDKIILRNKILEHPIEWGNNALVFGFNHEIKMAYKHDISILRVPYISLPYDYNYSPEEMLELVDKLCILMSLYSQQEITHFYSRIKYQIRKEKRIYNTIFKHTESIEFIDDNTYNEWFEDYFYFHDFLNAINYWKFDEHKILIKDIVLRMIKSLRVDLTSEFMLLYNVIEKIRNHYIHTSEKNGEKIFVDENYSFKIADEEIDIIIRNKLLEITDLLELEEIDSFRDKIPKRIDYLKLKSMKDQFNKFFDYVKVDPNDFGINFKIIIETRSKIFHGSEGKKDKMVVYNKQLRVLIKELVIKLIFNINEA